MTGALEEAGLVVGVLIADGRQTGGAVQSLGRIGPVDGVEVDIAVRGEGETALDHGRALQARYPGRHLLLLHEGMVLPSSFLEDVRSQIRLFAEKDVAWGVIGNAGIVFPYFKPVRNMLVAGLPSERFAGVLPAAQLDPHMLLVHREVDLSGFARADGCPADAPISDLATLAAWEAGRPCWICNLPAYVSSPPAGVPAVSDAWARYLATRYNNASFVASSGTIGLTGHAADARDYYYGQMEPALNRATRHLDTASVTVFLFATYYDPDIFDRCLMSVVSQFQRPDALYIVGLGRSEIPAIEEFRAVVERYRPYLTIHWDEEDLPRASAIDRLRTYLQRVPEDGYSMLAYDAAVLFPQAVRQIREFLQFTLRDRHVLPVTTAEYSRLYRSVETRFSSRPRVFFREMEKQGFTHKDQWLSSEANSTLHFTFPNRFLRETPLAGLDLFDLGSTLPQRLLAEPVSFFLIERGAGYTSYQKPSPDETVSPLVEAGTPFHVANKAGALMAARSNVTRYALAGDGIAASPSDRDAGEAPRQPDPQPDPRLAELEAYHGRAEHELARLRGLAEQQEASLNRFRNSWYFKTRRRLVTLFRRRSP